MFSQQELCRGMERDCYCCRPGPSLPSTAPTPTPFLGQTQAVSRTSQRSSDSSYMPACNRMDVDSALCELDNLCLTTGSTQSSTVPGCSGVQGPRAERKVRARSLSESMTSASRRPAKSHSETSLYRPLEMEHGRPCHYRRPGPLGSKVVGCSLSLPRKIGSYHMVQRNSAFVSDISGPQSCSPLEHSSSVPSRWAGVDSGVGSSFSEQSSSKSSSPSSMGSYRDTDLLEERSRQRRLSRYRLERSRRLRQPYSIPFRMCQSMSEDSTTTLTDFLTTDTSSGNVTKVSKSTTTSPVKQEAEAAQSGARSGSGSLVRWRSIDNLELARLRLTDMFGSKTADSVEQQEVEQVSTDLKNLQMV